MQLNTAQTFRKVDIIIKQNCFITYFYHDFHAAQYKNKWKYGCTCMYLYADTHSL